MAVEPVAAYSKTLVVWWQYGREHGGGSFRVNPQEVIDAHLRQKVDGFRHRAQQSLEEGEPWRWWQVDEGLILERPPQGGPLFGPDSRIYYLLDLGLAVIENVRLPPPDEGWTWYLRVVEYSYSEPLRCWLMKDLFCDIVVEEDNRTYHLLDLPRMAQALDIGLIDARQSGAILRRVDWVVGRIAQGDFPLEAIQRGRAAAAQLGW